MRGYYKSLNNGISTISVSFASSLIAFLLSTFLSKTLGTEDFGKYVLILSLFDALIIIVHHGMIPFLFKERVANKKNYYSHRELPFRWTAFLLATLLYLILLLYSKELKFTEVTIIYLMLVLHPFTELLSNFNKSIGKPASSVFFSAALPVLILYLCLRIIDQIWDINIYTVLWIYVIIKFSIYVYYIFRSDSSFFNSFKNIKTIEYKKDIMPYFLASIANKFVHVLPILFLGYYGSMFETALMGIIMKINLAMLIIFSSLITVISKKMAEEGVTEMDKLFKKLRTVMAPVGIFFIITVGIAGSRILNFWGTQYRPGLIYLVIVSGVTAVKFIAGPINHLFLMKGSVIQIRSISGTTLLVLLLSLLFLPLQPIERAIWSYVLANVFGIILGYFKFKKMLHEELV